MSRKVQSGHELLKALQAAAEMPKPVTGEWTVEGKAIWNDRNPVGIAISSQEAHQIADAHNAAIAKLRAK